MKNIYSILFLLSVVTLSCNVTKSNKYSELEINKLKVENDRLKNLVAQQEDIVKNSIATFLTFQDNNAENAMNFYVGLFDNSKIIKTQRWGKEGPGKAGKIMHATFTINGTLFMCSDSPPVHDWDFSPAISNFYTCKDGSEMERIFSKLSENGHVTMPLSNYGFSQKFGWVIDQFGISWQLNLE